MSIIETIKKNTLLKIILLLIAIYLGINLFNSLFGVNILSLGTLQQSKSQVGLQEGISNPSLGSLGSAGAGGSASLIRPPSQDYTPQTDVENRLVVQNSTFSLLVKDVVDTRDKVVSFAQQAGGYMVNVQTSNPQDTPTATIVVRVPSDKLEEALKFYRSLSVRVVSENLVGQDVTDQYVDIDTRISQIEKTKQKLEAILENAIQISDITNLTQQILNYQNQIDSLKGQKLALEQNAKLAKIIIYISTDEIALPYAPSETFRPGVIFKLAVRSLIGFLRNLASAAIWVGVYATVWVPALLIFIFVRRWWRKRKTAPKSTTN